MPIDSLEVATQSPTLIALGEEQVASALSAKLVHLLVNNKYPFSGKKKKKYHHEVNIWGPCLQGWLPKAQETTQAEWKTG